MSHYNSMEDTYTVPTVGLLTGSTFRNTVSTLMHITITQ